MGGCLPSGNYQKPKQIKLINENNITSQNNKWYGPTYGVWGMNNYGHYRNRLGSGFGHIGGNHLHGRHHYF